jgi:hypothetical protein
MYKGGVLPDSERRRKRQKRAMVVYFITGMFVASGIISLLWSVPRFPQILISDVSISGNKITEKENILKLVRKELSGVDYIFFPRANSFLLSTDNLSEKIKSFDPQILTADVSRNGLVGISIEVLERTPEALFCDVVFANEEKLSECYFADSSGFIYSKAPDFTASVYARFNNMVTTTPIVIGKNFIDSVTFKGLENFVDDLKKNGFEVRSVDLDSEKTIIKLEKGGEIYVVKEQDLKMALQNLLTLIGSKEFKGRIENGELRFNYIDLRFGNKLFYKI